jgi:hypothetical protein
MLFAIIYEKSPKNSEDSDPDTFPNILIGIVELILIISFIPAIILWHMMTKIKGTFTNPQKFIYALAFALTIVAHVREFMLESSNTYLKLLLIAVMMENTMTFIFFLFCGLIRHVTGNIKIYQEYPILKELRSFCLTLIAVVNLAWFIREFISEHNYGFNPPFSEIIVTGVIDFRLQTLFHAVRHLANEKENHNDETRKFVGGSINVNIALAALRKIYYKENLDLNIEDNYTRQIKDLFEASPGSLIDDVIFN